MFRVEQVHHIQVQVIVNIPLPILLEGNSTALHQRLDAPISHIIDIPDLQDDTGTAVKLDVKRIKVLAGNIIPGFSANNDQIPVSG